MMMRNSIKRRDIVTNEIFDKDELIRISISKDGVTRIDKDKNLGGRGLYIHPMYIKKGIDKNIIYNSIRRFKGNMDSILVELNEEVKLNG